MTKPAQRDEEEYVLLPNSWGIKREQAFHPTKLTNCKYAWPFFRPYKGKKGAWGGGGDGNRAC